MTYKAFNFRLYPTIEQAILMSKTFGCSRLVYNKALFKWDKDYEEGVVSSKKSLSRDLTELKRELDFLKEVDSIALQSAIFDLYNAFQMFFKKINSYPTYKKKYSGHQSYTTKCVNNNIAVVGSKVKLPKLGLVKFAKSREVTGKIVSATIKRNPSGKYFISILCDTEVEETEKTKKEIGIDLGITHFAITTDTNMQKIDNPRFIKGAEEKLRREQRVLSRRLLQAKRDGKPLDEARNYQKQRIKVAKLHEKVKNQRTDFLNKLSTRVVMENDLIAIEDLNVKGLARNHKLAKAIYDVSWGGFRRMLEYKCLWYGKTLVAIDRFYPSSQVCSSCGVLDGKKPLSIRVWRCSSCNTVHDRDVNASYNILNQAKNSLK